MDQEKIEEGLKRLERAAKVEREEKIKMTQEEEKKQHEEEVSVLSEDEEKKQNELLKQRYPNDLCPLCGTHVVDARYLILPGLGGCVVCGNCHIVFMPESRYEMATKILEERQEAAGSNIVVPKVAPRALPKITL